jgi:threonine dehydratase
MRVTRQDVQDAARRIDGRVRRTPLLPPARSDGGVWLKAEHLQHCGVFKTRGAFNRQLAGLESGEIGEAGVVIASGGNAGLAQAYTARELGIACTVFVPEAAPEVKVQRIRAYDADVQRVGSEFAQAFQASLDFANERGAVLLHAYDQVEVAAGAGTIAEEVLDDVPDLDTIVVAVGGGGLYAGIAASALGRARVVAVAPARCPTLHRAMAEGRPVDVEVGGVAADSLGARRLGELAFSAVQDEPPVSVLVSEEEILEARHRLWEDYRIASEHGAATAYAALTSGRYAPADGERIAVIVCGANTDVTTLVR